MTTQEAEKIKKFIDGLVSEEKDVEPQPLKQPEEPKKERDLPKDKRVVRTKSSGDRVYQLDEAKKTRAWITSPQVMKDLGWEMGDVKEISDADLLRFQMVAAIYRVER